MKDSRTNTSQPQTSLGPVGTPKLKWPGLAMPKSELILYRSSHHSRNKSLGFLVLLHLPTLSLRFFPVLLLTFLAFFFPVFSFVFLSFLSFAFGSPFLSFFSYFLAFLRMRLNLIDGFSTSQALAWSSSPKPRPQSTWRDLEELSIDFVYGSMIHEMFLANVYGIHIGVNVS